MSARRLRELEARLRALDGDEARVRDGSEPVPDDWPPDSIPGARRYYRMFHSAEQGRTDYLVARLASIEVARRALRAERDILAGPRQVRHAGGLEGLRADYDAAVAKMRRDRRRLSIRAVATELGIHRDTLAEYIAEGILPPLG